MTIAEERTKVAGGPEHGLTAEAYRSEEFWQKECQTVLSKNWMFIGFAHQVANPGDAHPVSCAGLPLLTVRGQDGGIQVFHNVCLHRCMTLVDKPKNVGKLIRCPYHAWAYDLEGRLRAAPHFAGTGKQEFDGFDLKEHRLKPVRTHVWHDWIFVNLDGSAPEFEDYAAPLISRLEGIDYEKLEPIGLLDFGEIDTNWKLIMENFIEPYHVQFVHSSTTDQPLEDHYTITDGNCLGSAVDLKEEVGTAGSLAVSSRYLTLYPNFILGRYFPDQLGVYLNVPVGPGKMRQYRALYTTEGQELSAEEIQGLKDLWWDVHKEDHEMVERMFEGRKSPVADDGGLLSPAWEDSVRAFQDMIERDIASDGAPAPANA
ncbi:aromatic ring-hydroxylating oxygenase subunit alpha [Leisingera sp. ANG-Vp]|uniref:aromatic ring-hydroxylating oxygenase subunit alpha n=1 Tax=Leisingera sp. ANG-Vp TaxID=1577896 RepID=UPI00057D48A2|nr:aromatic ring-hydroxylating dioxygenase subunit alpha [Leisingera sp. ANG-Vp]KIC17318.1 (2Fe-2S)-binding protein [Leisingera sp. ANG-Vp]